MAISDNEVAQIVGTITSAANRIESNRTNAELEEVKDLLRGMIGLVKLISGRNDMPPEFIDALKTNHRYIDACAFLNRKNTPNG